MMRDASLKSVLGVSAQGSTSLRVIPISIVGDAGMGKTKMAHALAECIRTVHGERNVHVAKSARGVSLRKPVNVILLDDVSESMLDHLSVGELKRFLHQRDHHMGVVFVIVTTQSFTRLHWSFIADEVVVFKNLPNQDRERVREYLHRATPESMNPDKTLESATTLLHEVGQSVRNESRHSALEKSVIVIPGEGPMRLLVLGDGWEATLCQEVKLSAVHDF